MLPKEIREALDIEEGQRVAFVKRGGAISLLPLNESLSDHYGSIEVGGRKILMPSEPAESDVR